MIPTEIPFGLTIRDLVAGIGIWGLMASLLTSLIRWLFCTKSVPGPVLTYRSMSLATFFCSLIVRGLSDVPIPWDANTLLVFANLALAQTLVMAFTYRRIISGRDGERGDRCPYPEAE